MKQSTVSSVAAAAASDELKLSASNESKDPQVVAAGSMATIKDNDERLLAQIGYKQVLPLGISPARS